MRWQNSRGTGSGVTRIRYRDNLSSPVLWVNWIRKLQKFAEPGGQYRCVPMAGPEPRGQALKVHKPQPHQQVHVQILKTNLHQDIHAVPNLVAAPSLYSPSLLPEAPDKTHLHRLQFSPPQIPPLTGGSSPAIRLWPAHADNSTPIELSSVWRFRRKLKEQKPCPPSASGLQLDSPGLTGYLIGEVNGGLNQQRSAICNAVALAGLLNTVLNRGFRPLLQNRIMMASLLRLGSSAAEAIKSMTGLLRYSCFNLPYSDSRKS
ncbi:hypothetical protein ACFX2J_002637 [Malus domestica]